MIKVKVKVNPRREISVKKHGGGHQQPNVKSIFQGKYRFTANFLCSKLYISVLKIKFSFCVLRELNTVFLVNLNNLAEDNHSLRLRLVEEGRRS